MDEEIERLTVAVRADTQGFARDVADMRGQLEGPFGAGITRVGSLLEHSLTRAIRTGKLGFEDLKSVALSALAEIAAASLKNAIGGGQGNGGGLLSAGASILSAVLGLPGRATGGPVSPGQAYLVGERGPEVFVPTSSGAIAAPRGGGAARDVRVSISVSGPAGSSPELLARSSRQVARAVRGALLRED
jgi:phage-related minor tail protein